MSDVNVNLMLLESLGVMEFEDGVQMQFEGVTPEGWFEQSKLNEDPWVLQAEE